MIGRAIRAVGATAALVALVELDAHLDHERDHEAGPHHPGEDGQDADDGRRLAAELESGTSGPRVADQYDERDRHADDERY